MAEALTVPIPGPPRPLRAPRVAERKLSSGLRVLAVRKASVPKIEMQLSIPLGRRSRSAAPERVLAKTMTSGTSSKSSVDIAMLLQALGATLNVGVGVDSIGLSGSVLAPNFRRYLDLLAEILTDAAYPDDEIALQRPRIVQEVQIARSQPQFVAVEAVRRRLFGTHPYGVVQPEPEAVTKIGRATLRRLHSERVLPSRAVLVLVGDLQPKTALDAVASVLRKWRGRTKAPALSDPPPIRRGPTLIVDRPGSVQTNIRIAGPALPLGHPESYALAVANAIFGGASMSRLMLNIREDKGYTYSPHSQLQHLRRAAIFEASADVGTEVTGPSLVETRYELGRMCALEVPSDELEGAKRYLAGRMSLQIQTQRGLAAVLANLSMFGLDINYVKEYPRRIMAVTSKDVLDVSRKHLAPGRLVTVLVGDAKRVADEVEPFDAIELTKAPA